MNALGSITGLAARNAELLRRGVTLILSIDDATWRALPPLSLRGGAGAHFRHVLEHYECFLAGLAAGAVDYERRPRDRSVERDRGLAAQRLERVARALEALEAEGPAARELRVAVERRSMAEVTVWTGSCAARELQFLLSHTVHHYAIIAVMLRLAGVEPGRDFGVAPSTLAYEEGGPLCAP